MKKKQIDALSNAFHIGFNLGSKPIKGGMHSFKAELKKAIEEGLTAISPPEQSDSGDTYRRLCPNCGANISSNSNRCVYCKHLCAAD